MSTSVIFWLNSAVETTSQSWSSWSSPRPPVGRAAAGVTRVVAMTVTLTALGPRSLCTAS